MIIEALTSGLTIKLVIIMIGKLCFFQNSIFLSINWQKIKFKTWLVLTSVPLVIIRLYLAHKFKPLTHFVN